MQIQNEKILVLDFGGQYAQLIARRVREHNVYCEILIYKTPTTKIKANGYKGIIFTGGPNSVYAGDSPRCNANIFELGIPVLGICYGAQLMAYLLGGEVTPGIVKEYGNTVVKFDTESRLFAGNKAESVAWMSHTDYMAKLPQGFKASATSNDCPTAAIENPQKNLYAVQFHPEVSHTEQGTEILHNFIYNICDCKGDWVMSSFAESTIAALKEKIGNKKVLVGLSGGVDSSVAAVLLHRAVGKNLVCIFVDHGLLRKNEGDEVERVFKKQFDMNLIRVNAQERFLTKLSGVADPETKRKIIGEEFIRVFEEESKKLGNVEFLVQGTIYPDVVESGTGEAAVIKSHHNVGGLPENIGFEGVVEPLRDLFKDEVRKVGLELDIPEFLVWRQPFPGPGLAIRVMGDITEEKLNTLRDADYIFREEIANFGLEREINQYFAVYTGVRSVGVMGDSRTYDTTIALRAVTTTDFMTADWAHIPYEVLAKVSNRIINEVKGVNRIVYDVTSKPPSTIEWE
ncbi:MAG: glutamine-hydrolyzing GMP synthase [Oscillospiraceae bacterium]|jgi:GMP synthase (glutamine-hydrolysing)|nr:glutamine-hydrolyzing GMP synthase [Oscillospiraceae bacterium]